MSNPSPESASRSLYPSSLVSQQFHRTEHSPFVQESLPVELLTWTHRGPRACFGVARENEVAVHDRVIGFFAFFSSGYGRQEVRVCGAEREFGDGAEGGWLQAH